MNWQPIKVYARDTDNNKSSSKENSWNVHEKATLKRVREWEGGVMSVGGGGDCVDVGVDVEQM